MFELIDFSTYIKNQKKLLTTASKLLTAMANFLS